MKIKERGLHLLILSFLVGLFLGANISFFAGATESAHKYLDYFHQVYQVVKTDYVEVPETKKLFYGAIRGVIKSLNDPYSRFLDEDAFSEFKEETSGEFVGVGIEITIRNGKVIVISPIEDTPAMKAGIKSGDIIIMVNKTPIEDMNLSQIVKIIRGLPHTNVKLFIRREGFDNRLEFDIERVPIKIKTVSFECIKDHNIGYLKIKLFNYDTPKLVQNAINNFNEKGIDRVIVDLRWNPGGLLDRAIKVSDLFLKKGMIIVSTRGRKGAGNYKEFKSIEKPLFTGKLIVLVNKGSASASEIFSGAIKDNSRGKLLGEKTFGKGSVQKFFNLDESIGMTLTIAKYYTPSGVSIHGKGIVPDYIVAVDKFSGNDKKNISIILKKNLMEKFVKTHKDYNAENRKEFIQFLKENDLEISQRNADYIFKNELNRYSKRNLYDLEFDKQLNKAIEIINNE